MSVIRACKVLANSRRNDEGLGAVGLLRLLRRDVESLVRRLAVGSSPECEECEMKLWTDYPILHLGDAAGVAAPIREYEVLSFDQNRYLTIIVEGIELEVKAGYVYMEPGRCGHVPPINRRLLMSLPATKYEE